MAVAVWSRVWIGWWALIPTGAVLIGTWLNPQLFSPLLSTNNWMSKGVLCGRIWLLRGRDPTPAHHAPVLRALIFAAFGGTVALIIGLMAVNLPLTLTGVAVAVLSKLWMLNRMVWIYAEKDGDTAASDAR